MFVHVLCQDCSWITGKPSIKVTSAVMNTNYGRLADQPPTIGPGTSGLCAFPVNLMAGQTKFGWPLLRMCPNANREAEPA
jgi:hypothetical protein